MVRNISELWILRAVVQTETVSLWSVSASQSSDSNPRPGFIRGFMRVLSHPAVFVPAALLSIASALLALWLRFASPEILVQLQESARLDLRTMAVALGAVGATGAANSAEGKDVLLKPLGRAAMVAALIGFLVGGGLLIFGLIRALVG